MNSILPEDFCEEKQIQSQTGAFFKTYNIGKLLKQANFNKEKGVPCTQIFRFIFMLIFTGKNFYQYLLSGCCTQFAKDTIYRFLNSSRFNWRKFLFSLSSTIIRDSVVPLTSSDREKVLIFDDSLYSRNRSKAVELLAKVYDHVEHKYVRGFRMLTLGWSDGNTFLPLAFSLLSSAQEKNRINEADTRIDNRSNGFKLRKECLKKSTEVMFDLLDQVAPYDVGARYLLFDSWFAYPKVILETLKRNLHVVCMLKRMPKVFYGFLGEQMNLQQLYDYIYKKPGRAKILASKIVELGKDDQGGIVKVKIVFIRDRRSKKWLALLTTDINLTDEDVVRIYGKRWDIEVFFKMSKSFLKLAKEYQGRSYDSMVAHTSIVFCRYMMLSLESRNNQDPRTLGNLFYICCDEMQDISFTQAVLLIIDLLKKSLMDFLFLSEQQVSAFLNHFCASLSLIFKKRLKISMCES